MYRGWHKFSQVSALVYLLQKLSISGTFLKYLRWDPQPLRSPLMCVCVCVCACVCVCTYSVSKVVSISDEIPNLWEAHSKVVCVYIDMLCIKSRVTKKVLLYYEIPNLWEARSNTATKLCLQRGSQILKSQRGSQILKSQRPSILATEAAQKPTANGNWKWDFPIFFLENLRPGAGPPREKEKRKRFRFFAPRRRSTTGGDVQSSWWE